MGASDWQYVTRYQQNVQDAFAIVCKEAYESGEWREALEGWTDPAEFDVIDDALSTLAPKPLGPRPRSWFADSGRLFF